MTPMSAGTEDLTSIERSNSRKETQMYIPKAVVIGFIAALGWAAGWLMYGATTASTSATPSAAATATRPAAARHRAAAGAAVAQPARSVARAQNHLARVGQPAYRDAPSRRAGRTWPTAVSIGQATTRANNVGVTTPVPPRSVVPSPASSAGSAALPAAPTRSDAVVATAAQASSAIAPTRAPVQPPVQQAVVQQPVRQPRTVVAAPSADGLGTGRQLQVRSAAPAPAADGLGTGRQLQVRSAAPAPHRRAAPAQGPRLQIPPFLATPIFEPLPGARSRGVSFMEWESYRLDVAGNRIAVTADDSNLFRNRDGKLNGNTGDTDASGLNIVDATDSVIFGSESADEAPYQTRAAARVDLASAESDSEESEEAEGVLASAEADEANGDDATSQPSRSTGPSQPTTPTQPAPARTRRPAPAAVAPPPGGDDDEDADEEDTGDEDDGGEAPDFPYRKWVASIRRDAASAVNTDDGTTLASGQDALVIGSDGYDDDDVRAAGSNIIITRDDGNVVLGGRGDVNAQIGDSEQGAVIMDIERTLVKGGGAY
jgi:hypothetical protein